MTPPIHCRSSRLLIATLCFLFNGALSCIAFAKTPGNEFPAFNQWPDAMAIETFVQEMKERHALDTSELVTALSTTYPNSVVLKYIAPPTDPRVKSWERYRARFMTQQRIQNGLLFWQRHAKSLAAAEAEYGIPAAIMVAIIGVETEYGKNTGNFETFEALATLAFSYPPRADFFRSELEQLILLARENQMPIRSLQGSYAGAIGLPQFMPGSQRRFAVDFDRDGKVDLMRSPVDAIGSVGHFLKAHGWIPGQPIMSKAPSDLLERDPLVSKGIKPAIDEAMLAQTEFATNQRPQRYPVTLVDLVTPDQATEYWWGYQNFYVITRYNRSSFYAMSVAQLAESIEAARANPGVLQQKAKPKKATRMKNQPR